MIVVSRDLKNYYEQQYGRMASYIPNGVERATDRMLSGSSVLSDFNLTPDGYFLYLARLVPEKRTEDLLRAFARVKTDKKLVIAGEAGYTDAYVAELRRIASSDNRVLFVGFQRGNAVHVLFHHASGYILPSEIEGLPLALLEAMSHGTVPLVSRIPPHQELLGSVPGYDLFFDPRDVDGLVASLNRVVSQPEHYRALGKRIQAFVEANYGWEPITDLTESLYYDALANGPDRAFDLGSGTPG
jgi:glycosyltransferase involved in cell wall biosynthesis